MIKHNGGIQFLSVYQEGEDGYIDYIWKLEDTSTWSNDDWWVGQVPFSTHRLVVECQHGDSTEGYAAIDSIFFDYSQEMSDCKIEPPEAAVQQPTTTTVLPDERFPDCEFTDNECGWIVDQTSNMKWMRTTNKDLGEMGYDGPSEEHNGYFMYVSAKDGYEFDETTLATPMKNTLVKGCLTFWFSIFVGFREFSDICNNLIFSIMVVLSPSKYTPKDLKVILIIFGP